MARRPAARAVRSPAPRSPRRHLVAAVCAGIASLSAMATAGAAATPPSPWTITVAKATSQRPDWAYPYMPGLYLSEANVQEFEQLMYRPLYIFGEGDTVALDDAASLAYPPAYSDGDTKVAVTLKSSLAWSNGDPVSPEGVMEWMNLAAAFPSAWADYLSPLADGQPMGIPDDVRSIAISGDTLTFTLAGPVNPTWFTDNELSQITPLPSSWDIYEPAHPHITRTGPDSIAANGGRFTAATAPGGCYGTTWIADGNDGPSTAVLDPDGARTVVPSADAAQAAKCVDVVDLMWSLSADPANYATAGTSVAATFDVSDGPWRLTNFVSSTGAVSMVANTAPGASGVRPTAAALRFVPCATARACEGLLSSGAVDQGDLPVSLAPAVSTLADAARVNPLAPKGYAERVVTPWATSYIAYNFDSRLGADGRAGAVFDQAVVRRAIDDAIDEPAEVGLLGGYGLATSSVVPAAPSNPFSVATDATSAGDAARGVALLRAHGWHVAAHEVTTCEVAARCGTGIAKGTPLRFSLAYDDQAAGLARLVGAVTSQLAEIGIAITPVPETYSALLGEVTSDSSSWDLADWGGGWTFQPGIYPSGEWTIAAGAPFDVGAYANPTATSLVVASVTTTATLGAYQAFVDAQLPVIWQPLDVQLQETTTSIAGAVDSPLGTFMPEAWRLAAR